MTQRLVYYHGCVVDTFDHKTGRAVIKLLEATGHAVEVPPLICCSFPLLNHGEFRLARKRAMRLVNSLSKYAEDGYGIIYSCPTCGYALKEVFPRLLSSEAADLVAANTHFVSSYLLQLQDSGERKMPLRETPLRLGYHSPCHLRSQGLATASLALLALIPGAEVLHVDRGCCGMGGTWALRSKEKGATSAQIGRQLFKGIQEAEVQQVATDCFGCELQIARFTPFTTTHPMVLLAEACE